MSRRPSEETVARVPIACTSCRKRKVKCVTESCQVACLRCERHGLDCEYVASDKQARFMGPSGSTTHTSHGQSSHMPSPSTKKPRQSHDHHSRPLHGTGFDSAPSSSNAHHHARINTDASGLYRPAHQRSLSPATPIYSPASSRLDGQYHMPDTQLIVGSITATRSATPSTWNPAPITQTGCTSTRNLYAQQSVATTHAGDFEGSNGRGYHSNNYSYPCPMCFAVAPCYCSGLRN